MDRGTDEPVFVELVSGAELRGMLRIHIPPSRACRSASDLLALLAHAFLHAAVRELRDRRASRWTRYASTRYVRSASACLDRLGVEAAAYSERRALCLIADAAHFLLHDKKVLAAAGLARIALTIGHHGQSRKRRRIS